MANPMHGTTTPDVVLPITLDRKWRRGEVMNVDGAAAVYFTVDGTTPTVGGDGCLVLPAAIGALPVEFAYGGSAPVVKFISKGAVQVSVRGT